MAMNFITPININFEHKKLFPGDIGPPTGEMGTLMFWEQPNGFFNATLAKMTEKLRASKYVGYIDINCIANARGIYPLEFTSRFGYPTISIHMEGISSPMGEFIYAIAKGEQYSLKTQNGYQIGVVVATPPFPYSDEKMFQVYKDASILFKRQNLDGIHLGDVKIVDNDWKIAGKSGYVLDRHRFRINRRRRAPPSLSRALKTSCCKICFIAPTSAQSGSKKATNCTRGECYKKAPICGRSLRDLTYSLKLYNIYI